MCDTIFIQTGDDEFIVGHGPLKRAEAPATSGWSFYANDFFLSLEKPWVIPSSTRTLTRAEAVALFQKSESPNIEWQVVDTQKFVESFKRVQKAITDRSVQKAVPILFEHGELRGTEAFPFESTVHSALEQSYSGLYLYGIFENGVGQLGLSPELLFEISDTTIQSYAIAGTADSTFGDSAVRNPKDSREHKMVVDDLTQKLDAFGTVHVDETAPWNVGALIHLRTPITTKLSMPTGFEETVRALHPSAALGTYPSNRIGWDLLQSEDTAVARAGFGAPFGVQRPDRSGFCIVAIRSIQFNSTTVRIGSGCGVIAESNLESEIVELALKRNSVKERLLRFSANKI